MKAPTSASATSQPKKAISSMSSISSKNIHSTVNQSLENPLLSSKVEEWTSEQVSTWLISVGFDKQLADNFKGMQKSHGSYKLECLFRCLRSRNYWRHSIGIDSRFPQGAGRYYIWQKIQNSQCYQCSSTGDQKAKSRCTESFNALFCEIDLHSLCSSTHLKLTILGQTKIFKHGLLLHFQTWAIIVVMVMRFRHITTITNNNSHILTMTWYQITALSLETLS